MNACSNLVVRVMWSGSFTVCICSVDCAYYLKCTYFKMCACMIWKSLLLQCWKWLSLHISTVDLIGSFCPSLVWYQQAPAWCDLLESVLAIVLSHLDCFEILSASLACTSWWRCARLHAIIAHVWEPHVAVTCRRVLVEHLQPRPLRAIAEVRMYSFFDVIPCGRGSWTAFLYRKFTGCRHLRCVRFISTKFHVFVISFMCWVVIWFQ